MDAREYLLLVNKICDVNEGDGCKATCPIKKYGCGMPKGNEDIDATLDVVEHWEETKFPFGRCRSCGREFDADLKAKQINYCPWCGEVIVA